MGIHASKIVLAVVLASAAGSVFGCSSCKQHGDCGRDECIQAPPLCVSRCAIFSIGDNYDFTDVSLTRVCLPASETDGGT